MKDLMDVKCGKCEHILPLKFVVYDDHGGVLVVCPSCKCKLFVSNGTLQDYAADGEKVAKMYPVPKLRAGYGQL